jgi:pyridoxine 4-dehydrogenase
MLDCVSGDADVGLAIARQHGVAAIGVAGTAWEVAAGKIRHIGVSNVSERELARARVVAPIVSVQNRYNLRDRSSDRLIDICAEAGIAFIPWYPLAAGRLASPDSALARIAQRRSATASQISLAWLLQRSPAMLPIPGTPSIAHLEENLASASIRLTSDESRTLASI